MQDGTPAETGTAEACSFSSKRLQSLDVYRGLVMFCLFASGFGLAKVAENYPENGLMQWLKFCTTHPKWGSQFAIVGFSPWDMIQPAFMFMVGVSMPYSYAKRAEAGHSFVSRMRHAWGRAAILVLLGVLLQSNNRSETNWLFTNVLSQIGLGYGLLYFLIGKPFRLQLTVGSAVLLGYYLLMVVLPFGLEGALKPHFENSTSMPQRFDIWFLNLFPRAKEFTGHAYATLNFVPSLVTMLMGVVCGELLRNQDLNSRSKLKRLLIGGAICLVFGLAWSPLCPIVKQVWTPTWTLFSGAYVIWFLALLYWIVDVQGWKGWWTQFFIIVGMNSIAAYLMGMLWKGWTRKFIHTHFPEAWLSGNWGPMCEATMVAAFFWLILLWMYRNRIFIRV